MRFVVRVDVLIVNNKEIIEPKTDYHIAFRQDRKEETASKNGDVGVLYPVEYAECREFPANLNSKLHDSLRQRVQCGIV